MRIKNNRIKIFAMVALLSAALPLHAQDSLYVHFAPPDVLPDADNRLAAIAAELDNPNDAAAVADAGQRFQTFLRDAGGGLIGAADGSETWVGNWIHQLADTRRRTLATAMQTLDAAAAQQALDDVKNNPGADPIDAYTIARRYSLTNVAVDALQYAAVRSRALGDNETADAFAALADNKLPKQPAISGLRVPFAAPWFGFTVRSAWTAMRSWPWTAGGTTFVVGPTQVVALTAESKVLWHGPVGEEAPAGSGAANPSGFTRGPAFAPAFFSVDQKPPAIVVVRQPSTHGNGWAIRALRGSDGKLLWTTESRAELSRLTFASTPVIAGRYVYAVAGEQGDDLDRLAVMALELTTGRQLWRCDLGSVSHPTPAHHNRPSEGNTTDPYRPWLNETAPAVSGDSVIVAPDVGVVVAVDRFDGSLRWLRPYTPLGLPIGEKHRSALEAALAARAAQQNHRPGDPTGLPLRWNNTPAVASVNADNPIAVAAPQDSASAFAFDIASGKVLWELAQIAARNPGKLDSPIESLSQFTLLGICSKSVVMQGGSLIALSLDDGHVIARTDLLNDMTGPAVISDDHMFVPARNAGKPDSMMSSDDLPFPVTFVSPPFNGTLKIDAVRKALQSNDSLSSFTLPK